MDFLKSLFGMSETKKSKQKKKPAKTEASKTKSKQPATKPASKAKNAQKPPKQRHTRRLKKGGTFTSAVGNTSVVLNGDVRERFGLVAKKLWSSKLYTRGNDPRFEPSNGYVSKVMNNEEAFENEKQALINLEMIIEQDGLKREYYLYPVEGFVVDQHSVGLEASIQKAIEDLKSTVNSRKSRTITHPYYVFVMPYGGKSIKDIKEGELSFDEAAEIIKQILEGVEPLKKQGLDFNIHNVVVSVTPPRAYIIDLAGYSHDNDRNATSKPVLDACIEVLYKVKKEEKNERYKDVMDVLRPYKTKGLEFNLSTLYTQDAIKTHIFKQPLRETDELAVLVPYLGTQVGTPDGPRLPGYGSPGSPGNQFPTGLPSPPRPMSTSSAQRSPPRSPGNQFFTGLASPPGTSFKTPRKRTLSARSRGDQSPSQTFKTGLNK